jgi:phospholipid/cholesterol/gamma-HCH transport system substrate-binding protein
MSRLERLYSPPEIGAPGKRESRRRQRDLFWSGVFVLAMALVAAGAFALLIPGLFGGAYHLRVYFADATGLTEGIQIIQDGYVIGIVEKVSPLFPGRDPEAADCPSPLTTARPRAPTLPCFRASLRIRDRWPVPTDSLAQIGSAGLLAGDAILIHPGADATLLADGERLATDGRTPDLLVRLNALTESLNDIVKGTIAPALDNIKVQIETLFGTGTDQGENRARLAGTLESVQHLAANIEGALNRRRIDAILSAVEKTTGNLAQASSRLGSGTEEITRTASEYRALAGDLRGLVNQHGPGIGRALDDTQNLLTELTADLTPILVNFEDLSRNLSAFSRDLRKDPAVIIKGRKVEEQAPWFK